jgi:hypothetical protein
LKQIRVYIPTTEGPSEVLSLIKEDPDIHSVVCLNRKANALPISSAYNIFVRRPTGVIERDFGHAAFRLDVSAPITNGSSWQLGAYVAHALAAEGSLATSRDNADKVIWLSGEVDGELKIHPVTGITEKLKMSKNLLDTLHESNTQVSFYLHPDNAAEARASIGETAKIKEVSCIQDLYQELAFGSPKIVEENNVRAVMPQKNKERRRYSIPKVKSLVLVSGVAIIFAVLTLSIKGGGYDYWSSLLFEGEYRRLNKSLTSVEESNCLTCRLAKKIFIFRLKFEVPEISNLSVKLESLGVPVGQKCGVMRLSNSFLRKRIRNLNGQGELTQDRSLCAVSFEVSNSKNSNGTAWVTVLEPHISEKFNSDIIKRKNVPYTLLDPGEVRTLPITVSPYLSKTLKYTLVMATTPRGISNDLEDWLMEARKYKHTNWQALNKKLNELGITTKIEYLTIFPNEVKPPRFQ